MLVLLLLIAVFGPIVFLFTDGWFWLFTGSALLIDWTWWRVLAAFALPILLFAVLVVLDEQAVKDVEQARAQRLEVQ